MAQNIKMNPIGAAAKQFLPGGGAKMPAAAAPAVKKTPKGRFINNPKKVTSA